MKRKIRAIAFVFTLITAAVFTIGCSQVDTAYTGDPDGIRLPNNTGQSDTHDTIDVVAPGEDDDRNNSPNPDTRPTDSPDSHNNDGNTTDTQDPSDDGSNGDAQDPGDGDGNTGTVNAGGDSNTGTSSGDGNAGTSGGDSSGTQQSEVMDLGREMLPLTAMPAMFHVDFPSAPGTDSSINEKSEIDYSNASNGYVMIRFLQTTNMELRVRVTGPSEVMYTYILNRNGNFDVYPLAYGSGSYTISVFEQIDGNRYATVNTVTIDVTLSDPFAPFLRPNQYVNFTPGSRTVAKAAELIGGHNSFRERVAIVYDFVVNNLTYNSALVRNGVPFDYLPNLDNVLAQRTGICFDYASLMTAMLRSQGIPTRLVIGYAGDAYHAWINVYSDATGWLNNIIFFDGRTWNMMDPTYASTGNQSAAIMQYIGDGTNYRALYLF